jgi:hypothetical protein
MSDDKNKSYQDGLYNQPYNGRNWDQWVSGNNARTSGQSNNYYSGPTTSGASMQELSDGEGGDINLTPAGALWLLALPVLIPSVATAAILGIIAAPLLKIAERIIDTTERKSFFGAYVTAVKALSAFGVFITGSGFIFHFLARYVFHNGIIASIAMRGDAVFYSLLHGQPIPPGALLVSLTVFGLPALAAFAYSLKRDYKTVFAGRRGFFRGLVTALSITGPSVTIVGLLYALFTG